jgi:hypothetical protein
MSTNVVPLSDDSFDAGLSGAIALLSAVGTITHQINQQCDAFV